MRPIVPILQAALFLVLLFLMPAAHAQTAGTNTAPPAATPAPPDKPDPLDKEVVLFGFGIRPPKDYLQTTKDLTHVTAIYWTGPMHQNGILPRLGFALLHNPQNFTVRAADGRVMSYGEVGMRVAVDRITLGLALTGVSLTPVQQGRVGPLPALRVYWKGIAHPSEQTPIQVEGFVYSVQDGQNTALLLSLDCAPYGVTEFPIMDASVQTLHKVH